MAGIRSILAILGTAGLAGAFVGVGSIAFTPQGRGTLSTLAKTVAVDVGVRRLRDPQPDDHWDGCNDARRAGTAPIYAGEPGYRADMDGDRDGIACEPVRE